MSVTMRLARGGRKKMPFYHVVVTDSRNARDGRYIEKLGYFNPMAASGVTPMVLNEERINYWHGVGAQTSDALAKIFVDNNVGPEKVRAEYTKRIEARKALVAKRNKAEAAKKAAEEAKAKAEAEAEAAVEAAEAAPAEETPTEAATEEAAPVEEAPAEEPKQEAAAEEKADEDGAKASA